MRINEAFGDVVLWDLIPVFAIEELQESPGSNPVFGLNALGGAVTLRMKDGFDFSGRTAELAGGSFGLSKGTDTPPSRGVCSRCSSWMCRS